MRAAFFLIAVVFASGTYAQVPCGEPGGPACYPIYEPPPDDDIPNGSNCPPPDVSRCGAVCRGTYGPGLCNRSEDFCQMCAYVGSEPSGCMSMSNCACCLASAFANDTLF